MSTTSDSTTSTNSSSSRGGGFSMKSMLLALVFGVFAAPASAGMMGPMMPGMDPMMMGGGMPMMDPGMPMGGVPADPMMMHAMGYHYKRGRKRGFFGLLGRRPGHWRRNNYYGYGPMGVPGMGMPIPPMEMDMSVSSMTMMPGMSPMMPGMMPVGYRYKRGRKRGLFGLLGRRPGHLKPVYGYGGIGVGVPPMAMAMPGMTPMIPGMGMPAMGF